jgi:endonuclease/exonuclease/phosphatase family metal-dependent hydrolase
VPLRFASFNTENLFSRARILNLRHNADVEGKLVLVDEFNHLIHKQGLFTEAEKQRIVALYQQLKRYVDIHENRGKLFNRARTALVAASGSDWDGEVIFRRDDFSAVQRENTAKVIREVRPDIACIVEVEDRPALAAFNSDLLGAGRFREAMVIDGNDPRGIDVGVLTNLHISGLRTHIYDGPANSRVFSRDCLQVEMKLASGRAFHLLCNHFKSKSGGEAATDGRRLRQATTVRAILAEYDLANDLVVVAGDLNETPSRAPLQPLLTTPDLFDVLALQFPGQSAERWTYHYQSKEQIDYVLVSRPLRDAFRRAGVERRGIAGLSRLTGGAEQEFPTVTSWRDQASDHGAVWAEFNDL